MRVLESVLSVVTKRWGLIRLNNCIELLRNRLSFIIKYPSPVTKNLTRESEEDVRWKGFNEPGGGGEKRTGQQPRKKEGSDFKHRR